MTECHRMLQEIGREARATAIFTGRNAFSERVMQALAKVPRERFVPESLSIEAYENTALPIGFEQTISQPYMVALMSDLLDTQSNHRCLEVGTGSGFQAAVLSHLVAEVYSIEIIAPLYRRASELLTSLGYNNVHTLLGDGNLGCVEYAPYDRIIVTAAAEQIPLQLVDQLKPGGRMVIPIGLPGHTQTLYLVQKNDLGEVESRSILPVIFVPLIEPEAC